MIREQLAALGLDVRDAVPVGGGDICRAYRVRTGDGRTLFAKARDDAPAGFFAAEAAGLRWLAEGGAAVPEVVARGEQVLVLEWVEPGAPSAAAAERFGRELAALHRAGAAAYGADRAGFIGPLPLDNTPAPDWPAFYAERRVRPYLRLAADRGAVSADDRAAVEQVVTRVETLAGPAEQPARLHGDLWSGNVHWAADGRVWLVDPAAHGGHRETDLAMLQLFGLPHLDTVLAAYGDALPPADGWQARVPLHQLHPLLVHAALFGGSYGARAGAAARQALAAG